MLRHEVELTRIARSAIQNLRSGGNAESIGRRKAGTQYPLPRPLSRRERGAGERIPALVRATPSRDGSMLLSARASRSCFDDARTRPSTRRDSGRTGAVEAATAPRPGSSLRWTVRHTSPVLERTSCATRCSDAPVSAFFGSPTATSWLIRIAFCTAFALASRPSPSGRGGGGEGDAWFETRRSCSPPALDRFASPARRPLTADPPEISVARSFRRRSRACEKWPGDQR